MGVGLNTMLAAVGATGVAASKVATSFQGQGVTSEANDADKNEMMAQKAKYQAERLKQIKLQNKNLRLRNKMMKDTLKKNQEVKPDEQK